MTDIITPTEPSSPDPALVTLVASALRSLLMLLSGVGLLGGLTINDGTLLVVASALVGLGTAIWSIVEHIRAKRRDHIGSVLSAEQGKPVQPKSGNYTFNEPLLSCFY